MIWPAAKTIPKGDVTPTSKLFPRPDLGVSATHIEKGHTAQEMSLVSAAGERTPQKVIDCWRSIGNLDARNRRELTRYLNLLGAVDFGAQTEHLWVETTPWSRIEVLCWGSQGKPLLILPGFEVTAPVYHYLVRTWQSKHQVMAAHAPGVGMSHVNEPQSLTLAGLADHWHAVLQRLDVRDTVHVIGSSWGGLAAQSFAAHFPDRIASLVLLQTTDQVTHPAADDQSVRDEVKDNFQGPSRYSGSSSQTLLHL